LREREQHVEGQPLHRCGCVELLGDRHERYAAGVEQLDYPRKICARSCEPVNLVNHDDIDQTVADTRPENWTTSNTLYASSHR
jgi:hypothetical protein